jgi:Zn-dependent protease with chaperone function
MWIPGVAKPYLRACVYTCDRYAAYYSGNVGSSKNSLVMLAIGKKLFYRTDQGEFKNQINQEKGLFVWMREILSTHPPLPKRIMQSRPTLVTQNLSFCRKNVIGYLVQLLG